MLVVFKIHNLYVLVCLLLPLPSATMSSSSSFRQADTRAATTTRAAAVAMRRGTANICAHVAATAEAAAGISTGTQRRLHLSSMTVSHNTNQQHTLRNQSPISSACRWGTIVSDEFACIARILYGALFVRDEADPSLSRPHHPPSHICPHETQPIYIDRRVACFR